nr:PREDICTED: DNA-binding protein inhibitor ID-4 [Anolis carolinensis]|eukprot:XP_008107008.2 PREDICTED: DNA-binding protein inhibitor ID-4 [Anolis carolinensis]
MKAVSPVRHPNRKALASGCCCGGGGGGGGGSDGGGGGGGDLPLGFLSDPGCLKGNEVDEPAALCLQCDMNDCYSRLRKLVPTIPPHKRVSKVEILQHVIDYILDLQLALETHPALLRQQQQQQPLPQQPPQQQQQQQLLAPHQAPRTPLTALNVDPAAAVNKQGDSILCR